MSPDAIAAAYVAACQAELDALKPGNVHRFAGGHGMEVAAFEESAAVSAPFMGGRGLSLGARVLGAVEATRARVGMNTNLGILLLCAPLAMAAERGGDLRGATRAVLADLSPADAAATFRAIALAAPGGLGTSEAEDVSRPPSLSLVEAMRIAAPRDRIAKAYSDGLADVFDLGLPALDASQDEEFPAATRTFLTFAATFPDSHIARKYGAARAESVRRRFEALGKRLKGIANPQECQAALFEMDRALKDEGINPGTSADLTVASIFAFHLLGGLKNGEAGD